MQIRAMSAHQRPSARARRVLLALGLAAATGIGGCDHYRAPRANGEELTPARQIRVVFEPAQRVTLASMTDANATAGSAVVARELVGRFMRASGDSLTLEVWGGRDASGAALAPPPGSAATIARAGGVRIEVRAYDPTATRRAGYVAAVGAALLAAGIYLIGHMYST